MKFTKMHGIGNDYVYVNCFLEKVDHASEVSRIISDRHFGVGSVGLILICPSEIADFQMIMYNADGSRAQMCGNGIRCVGKYVYDRGLTDKKTITIETLAGIKTLQLTVKDGAVCSITVDMGEPILMPEKVPVKGNGNSFVNIPVTVAGSDYRITAVSMGNPHAVVFMPHIDDLDLCQIGPLFESLDIFPERTNTEFVEVLDRSTMKMRVWERGAGETLACGTGACASLVAAVLCGKSERSAVLKLLGGDLRIDWDEATNHVYMTGPAAFVFDGEIDLAGKGSDMYGKNQ